jgi:hypothetical protein
VTNSNGNWLVVVGAKGSAPIVVADGNPVALTPKARIMLTPGGHYARGFVTISDLISRDVQRTNDPDLAVDMEDTMQTQMEPVSETFKANLTPDVDIPGAYALLIDSPHPKSPDAPASIAVIAHDLGDLKAGMLTQLSVVLPKIGPTGESGWGILVFAGGRQVRSTGMGQILPRYFDWNETLALKKSIAERVAKGADAPIAEFRQMPLGLSKEIMAKYHGTSIKVEISIGADGSVLQAAPVGMSDPDLSGAISAGFAKWLFLPPIKNGAAVPGSVIVPLNL